MEKLQAISVSLLIAISCLRAQDQEHKLVDRLLRPDMTLQNSEQNKKFIADGTSIDKKARAGSRNKFENSSQKVVGNSQSAYPTQSARGQREASQSDKKVVSRAYAGNRPFLDQGKSQKSLNQQNAPLTIDQVRELLNKNK
jgi:hypothetical protein